MGSHIEDSAPWLDEHPGYRLARHGRRIHAYMIDFTLFAPFFWCGMFLAVDRLIPFLSIDLNFLWLEALYFLLVLFLSGAIVATPITFLMAFMLSRTGQTPGKKLTGIRVVRTRDPQERLSTVRGFVRQMFGLVVGFWWFQRLQSKDRRSMQDLVAGTIVVEVDQETVRLSRKSVDSKGTHIPNYPRRGRHANPHSR